MCMRVCLWVCGLYDVRCIYSVHMSVDVFVVHDFRCDNYCGLFSSTLAFFGADVSVRFGSSSGCSL